MSVPFWHDRSEWQTPDAAMRTFTSPAWGASTVMSSRISRGWPTAGRTAARVIGRGSYGGREGSYGAALRHPPPSEAPLLPALGGYAAGPLGPRLRAGGAASSRAAFFTP